MKKISIALAISAATSGVVAQTTSYDLTYAGYLSPYGLFPDYYNDVSSFSATYTPTSDGSVSTFSISMVNNNTYQNSGDFSYQADWNYYAASGAIVAYNITCTSPNIFCDSNILGGLQYEGGFAFVTAEDTQTRENIGIPVPGVDAFDLRWEGTGSDGAPFDWKLTFSPVPVPAAAWLFGSALVGLAGLKRKN